LFWSLSWEEYSLLAKAYYKKSSSLYIQRETLARMVNGVPVVKMKDFGTKKGSQIFPLDGEKDYLKDMMDEMKVDIAFKPGVVYIEGQGFVDKSELNGKSS